MAMDMVRMPPEMSRGFVSALDFGNQIVRFPLMGNREVVRKREQPMRSWQATKGVFSRDRIEEFSGFVMARHGAFHAFRFWDPKDFSTNPNSRVGTPSPFDQFLGYGDGVKTEFELRRVYASTATDLPQRRLVEDRMLWIHGETDARLNRCIGLPSSTTLDSRFAFDASEVFGFTINHRKRTVRFLSAPGVGVAVRGGGYYDWPVTLGEDADANFETIADSWTAQSAPNIPLELVPQERFAPETDDPGGFKTLAWTLGSPLLQKVEAKWWRLNPGVASLSVTLEMPTEFNSGGPHFVLVNQNAGSHAVAVKDELTGATIVTLSNGQAGWFLVEQVGSTRNWFYFIT